MTGKDEYYNRAKQEGYRARSAYKLQQLDDDAGLLSPGDTVVDLGAAPGGWMQVAAERVGPQGLVVGVDRKRIESLDTDARVEVIQGDLTEDETIATIRQVIDGEADLVISDMAPNISGEYELDHARSIHLARTALEAAKDLLAGGGDYVAKVFEGPDTDDLRSEVEDAFEYARTIHPDASRDSSSELYLVGKRRLTAPVRAGDRVEVEIEDTGSEGDGVAKVDGFTLFVPGAEEGDTVTVEVEEVKPRFGFAELVD